MGLGRTRQEADWQSPFGYWKALLRKSGDSRTCPIPGRIYPTTSVRSMPIDTQAFSGELAVRRHATRVMSGLFSGSLETRKRDIVASVPVRFTGGSSLVPDPCGCGRKVGGMARMLRRETATRRDRQQKSPDHADEIGGDTGPSP